MCICEYTRDSPRDRLWTVIESEISRHGSGAKHVRLERLATVVTLQRVLVLVLCVLCTASCSRVVQLAAQPKQPCRSATGPCTATSKTQSRLSTSKHQHSLRRRILEYSLAIPPAPLVVVLHSWWFARSVKSRSFESPTPQYHHQRRPLCFDA